MLCPTQPVKMQKIAATVTFIYAAFAVNPIESSLINRRTSDSQGANLLLECLNSLQICRDHLPDNIANHFRADVPRNCPRTCRGRDRLRAGWLR